MQAKKKTKRVKARRTTTRKSMSVTLPASQQDYVRARATDSGCRTPSEYVRRLIDADRRSHEQESVETRLLEGLATPLREMTSKRWSELRRFLREEATRVRRAQ